MPIVWIHMTATKRTWTDCADEGEEEERGGAWRKRGADAQPDVKEWRDEHHAGLLYIE